MCTLSTLSCFRILKKNCPIPVPHSTPIVCPLPPPPPSPLPPPQRDATPRANTAAGYITAGYITDPDTHHEQCGPLSDFWVPGRLPGGSREAKEGATPCAPCRTPCTSGRPPRAPTHGLTCPGCGETSFPHSPHYNWILLIICTNYQVECNQFNDIFSPFWRLLYCCKIKYCWGGYEKIYLSPKWNGEHSPK